MNIRIGLLLLVAIGGAGSFGAPIEFDFKDPKGVNNVVFQLDAPLEAINGTATGISGKVTFDPEAPERVRGTIIVAAKTLHVGNPMQNEHLLSDRWMNVEKYPEIRFEVEKASSVKSSGGSTMADVTGKMTIKGVTKTLTVPVKITYLPGKLKARSGQEGDLLVLRATFEVRRSDFGINPGQFEDKVSDEIELKASIAGSAPK